MVVEVLVIDVLVEVDIIAVDVIVIVLKFILSASYSVDTSSDVTVDLSMDVLADAMIGVLPMIGIEVLADSNANTFAVVKTVVEFPVSAPLEEFSR